MKKPSEYIYEASNMVEGERVVINYQLFEKLVERIQNDAWNEAIDATAESVELAYRMPENDEYCVQKIPCGVDKHSILKLKR